MNEMAIRSSLSGIHRAIAAAGCACFAAILLYGCGVDPAAEFSNAQTSFASGDLAEAYIHINNVLQAEPENGAARVLAARIALASGNPRLAKNELERARGLGVSEESIALSLADALVQLGEADAALMLFERVPEASRTADYWLRLGEAFIASGDLDKAAENLKRSSDEGGRRPRQALAEARLALLLEHPERADTLFDEAIRLAGIPSEKADALMARAEFYLRTKRLPEAAEDLEDAVRLYAARSMGTKEMEALTSLVQTYIALNDLDGAERTAHRLAERAPDAALANYAKGIVAYRSGRYSEAVTLLQRALNAAPDNALFQTLLGAAHLASGNLNQAEQQLRAALVESPRNPAAVKLLAETRLRQHRPADALDALRALADESGDPQVDALRGVASLQDGRTAEALSYLERAVAARPEDKNIRLQLARAYIAAGRGDDALQALRQVSDGDSAISADVLALFGRLQAGDRDGARKDAETLVEKFPNEPRAQTAAGIFYELTDDKALAERRFRDAIAADERFVAARLLLAGLLSEQDRAEEAESLYKSALSIEPGNTTALASLAELAYRRGDIGAAESLLSTAVEGSPTVPLRLLLARVELRQGKKEAARKQIDAASAQAPDDVDVTAARGSLALAEGKTDDAVRLLRVALERDPARLDLALQLAQAQADAQDLEAARATLLAAAARSPKALPIREALGAVELRLGHADEALENAKALQVDYPKQASGYILEADVRMAQRRYASAVSSYELAFSRSPRWKILAQRLVALQLAGEADQIEPLLRAWLGEHPDNLEGRLMLANLLQSSGRQKEAIAEYNEVLASRPDNVVALNNAAWLYQLTSTPGALELAEKAYELAPRQPAVLDTLGWILVRQGRMDEGLKHLKEAAEKAPESADIRYHYSYALAKSGKTDEARALLEPLLDKAQQFESRAEAEALYRSL